MKLSCREDKGLLQVPSHLPLASFVIIISYFHHWILFISTCVTEMKALLIKLCLLKVTKRVCSAKGSKFPTTSTISTELTGLPQLPSSNWRPSGEFHKLFGGGITHYQLFRGYP